MKTGTIIFFNGHLLHRSRNNRGTTYRRVLVNYFMNSCSLLPWSLRQASTLITGRRQIVPFAGIDSYARKGYDNPSNQVYGGTWNANRRVVNKEADAVTAKE